MRGTRYLTVGEMMERLSREPADAVVCVPEFDHRYRPLQRSGVLVTAVRYRGGDLMEDPNPPDVDEFVEQHEDTLTERIADPDFGRGVRRVIYLIAG